MKNNIVIVLLAFIWLVLVANIIWQGTDGRWSVEDAEKIGDLEAAKYTNQIILVAVDDEGARLCFYERVSNSERLEDDYTKGDVVLIESECQEWKLVLETEAFIGKNGLGKTKEGDGKTPVGVFLFIKAFGILENPGTKLEYTQVDNGDYWVDDSYSKYYNQFVDIGNVMKDWKSAEHIAEYGECYYYVLATSYNVERIPGKGSAVFLHCTSENAEATAGCIAVPEVYMREIMKRVRPQCVLIIDEVEDILSY